MTFRTRLTIAFTLLSLLMIGGEFLVNHVNRSSREEQVAVKALQTASFQAIQGIDRLMDDAFRTLQMVARSAYLNESGRSIPSINRRLADFRDGSLSLSRFSFLNSAGVLVADSDNHDPLETPQFKEAWTLGMADRSGFIVRFEQEESARGLLFYAPVRQHPAQPPNGVIVALLPVSRIAEQLDCFKEYRDFSADQLLVALTSPDGRLFCSSTLPAATSLQTAPTRPATADSSRQTVHDAGSSLIITTPAHALSSRSGTSWHLQVTSSKELLFSQARQNFSHSLQVLGVMLAVGITGIFLLTRSFSRPLEELAEAARRRGAGDTAALETLPERHDELALLQVSLQQMSANLQESIEQLQTSEERFHSLFDAMSEGAALHALQLDQNGTPVNYLILEVNRSYQDILGISREAAVGRLATEVYQAAYPPYLEEFAQVTAGGSPCCFETYFAPLDRHFQISACPTGPGQFATIFSDITAKKWHEDQLHSTMAALKVANEAKSRFLAVMSHEIRTPLNGITGMVQLLRDMEMPPLQREFLDNIDTSAESLLNVINDILDFSKIEAGRMDLEQLPFDPCTMLNGTLRVLRLRAQAKGLQLSLVCDPGMPQTLVGDPHRLGQVLTNLVNNAIKFTVGGEITIRAGAVSLEEETFRLTVSVRDPGIGMDEATQRTIFEPYIQADSSTTRRFGGTGLGLAICKQLVELMQGSISVESRPGDGSTFTFWVPLKKGAQTQATEQAAAIPGIDQPLRILVAEDQPVNQRFVAEILRKQGHTPLLAGNGEEAVEVWMREAVDLVLMDIQMPVMDGLKALAAIRAAEDGTKRHTPIIALTAHAIVGDRERLLDAGFDGYLSKPLQAAALFEAMARALELIRQERRP